MENFYKSWFEKNRLRKTQKGGENDVDSTSGTRDRRSKSPIAGPSSRRSRSGSPTSSPSQRAPSPELVITDPTQIVYEHNGLQLIVNRGAFKRQKLFRLQDHLFHFKIVQSTPNQDLPLLSDIYDFLHAALLHVLESIKTFYRPEDHNIAYLTLHQEPMINGLNTGEQITLNNFFFFNFN